MDGSSSKAIDLSQMESDDEDIQAVLQRRGPSAEALAKISDYRKYVGRVKGPFAYCVYSNSIRQRRRGRRGKQESSFETALAVSELQDHGGRLVDQSIWTDVILTMFSSSDADELEWYIPSVVLPSQLQSSVNIINQYLERPIDLEGKKSSELLKKKKRRRVRRRRSPTPDSDAEDDEERAADKKRREKRRKEKQLYKSAEFIVDSDAEMGDMESFLERERELRARTNAKALAEGGNMRAHGTKKRRRKGKDEKGGKKRRKRGDQENGDADGDEGDGGSTNDKGAEKAASDSDESELDVFGSPKRARSEPSPDTSPPADGEESTAKPKPRPRPRPRARASKAASPDEDGGTSPPGPGGIPSPRNSSRAPSFVPSDDEILSSGAIKAGKRRPARLVVSDDDE